MLRGGGALEGLGTLKLSPVEGLAFDVGPHNFHAACVNPGIVFQSAHKPRSHSVCLRR